VTAIVTRDFEVLLSIAAGRADIVHDGKEPPFIVHMPRKRAALLREEMSALGVAFGIPIGVDVPEPRDDEGWKYLGVILADVHVYERVARDAARG
jgi:hypothetical protein